MTGLLIKDLKLLKNQGRFFLTILIIGISIMIIGDLEYTSFFTNYMTIVLSLFTMSTISYDEFDNGMSYLMTLPVSRRDYVREKYLFGFLLTFSVWFLSAVVSMIYLTFRYPSESTLEWGAASLFSLLTCLLLISLSLPLHLKFGPERSRTVVFGIFGVITLIGILGYQLAGGKVLQEMKTVFQLLDSHLGSTLILSVLCTAALLGVSYLCSVRTMEKREF